MELEGTSQRRQQKVTEVRVQGAAMCRVFWTCQMIELINLPYPWLLVKDGACHHFITHRGELTEELWAVRGLWRRASHFL